MAVRRGRQGQIAVSPPLNCGDAVRGQVLKLGVTQYRARQTYSPAYRYASPIHVVSLAELVLHSSDGPLVSGRWGSSAYLIPS